MEAEETKTGVEGQYRKESRDHRKVNGFPSHLSASKYKPNIVKFGSDKYGNPQQYSDVYFN